MLIYDVNKGEFTKLAEGWDWEAIAQYAKTPAYLGLAGAALGALLDILYPSYKSRILPLGLLGLAGGGLYNVLGGVKPREKPENPLAKHFRAVNTFLDITTNKPLTIPNYTPERLKINAKDPAGLYGKLVGSALTGDVSLLKELYQADKTSGLVGVNDLPQFIEDVEGDISLAFVATTLAGADMETIQGLLERYLQNKKSYYATLAVKASQPENINVDPNAYKKEAEHLKGIILELLKGNPENQKYLTGNPMGSLFKIKQDFSGLISELGKKNG